MKANDLSIGDFVFVKSKNKIGIVHEIYYRSAHVWCGETYGSIYADRYDYDDIVPIPLTEEILKRSKWINRTDEHFSCCHNVVRHAFEGINRWHPARRQEDFCLISFDSGSFGLLVTGRFQKIKYVHELQRALRLSGLEELISELKVED